MSTGSPRDWTAADMLRFVAASAVGFALSTADPVGIAAAITMPALVLRQDSRRSSYYAAAAYYGCAIWPVVPAARNFFGPHVSVVSALALWVFVTAALALPWAAFWCPNRKQLAWRAPVAVIASVVPPLGIIGWASPLSGAGYLFPGTAWFGFFVCVAATGFLATFPRLTAPVLTALALIANAVYPGDPKPPMGWKAVNTHFGAIAHSEPSAVLEYQVAEAIQSEARASDASVIVFPETVVPFWTDATDAFWKPALNNLQACGKTVLIGAKLLRATGSARSPELNFSAAVAALKSGTAPTIRVSEAMSDAPAPSFTNAVIVRGSERATFHQRIPVPIAMWNPFSTAGARLNLMGPGVLSVHGERVAVLICYEQLLTWPILTSMMERPTLVVGIANDYWATETPIPSSQRAAVRAWSRLFDLPFVLATNS